MIKLSPTNDRSSLSTSIASSTPLAAYISGTITPIGTVTSAVMTIRLNTLSDSSLT